MSSVVLLLKIFNYFKVQKYSYERNFYSPFWILKRQSLFFDQCFSLKIDQRIKMTLLKTITTLDENISENDIFIIK